MTAVETYYSTLPASDRPYFAGEDDASPDDPLLAAAEEEAMETQIYKYF